MIKAHWHIFRLGVLRKQLFYFLAFLTPQIYMFLQVKDISCPGGTSTFLVSYDSAPLSVTLCSSRILRRLFRGLGFVSCSFREEIDHSGTTRECGVMLCFCGNEIVIAPFADSHLAIYCQLHFPIYDHTPLRIIMAVLRHLRRTIHLKENQLMLFALQYPSFDAFERDICFRETCDNLREILTAFPF